MSKRLKLAKNLLKETGIIFISIGDDEIAQLKLLCDRIFGPQNLIQTLIWHSKYTVSNDAKFFSKQHEYVLSYGKAIEKTKINLLPRSEKADNRYKNPDNDHRGVWKSTPLHAKSGSEDNIYEYVFNNGVKWTPPIGTYPRYSMETLRELEDNKKIWFGKKGKSKPSKKTFLYEVQEGIKCGSILPYQFFGHTHKANEQLALILGKGVFGDPKPYDLILKLITLAEDTKNSVILDFFAGSGTTGQAILELNKRDKDGGNRQFILCTNNENNICSDVCYPRIKNVIQGYNTDKSNGLGGNLKYFKTAFVPQVLTDNDKRVLVARSTELLCLAESTFDLVKQNKNDFAIFENPHQYTAIIYDEDSLSKCKKTMKKLDESKPVCIYVFSYDHTYDADDFKDLLNVVKIKPIPEAILNVYRKLSKYKKK